ncbi:zinc finger protein 33A-like [Homarus americanus]|uniref:zinc finger protein 33A-like n=1 Tax=Homarus americanus TaxID=6706 RepID=UPI001C45BC60|nr:zinc finger protein 33A-like [Homarus americanus]
MSKITDESPSEMNDFKCQLSGLLATLQKLPCGEQQAALDLLQLTLNHQLHDKQHSKNRETLSVSEEPIVQEKNIPSSHQEVRNVDEIHCNLKQDTLNDGLLQDSQQEALDDKSLHGSEQQILYQETVYDTPQKHPLQEKLPLDILHHISDTESVKKTRRTTTEALRVNLPLQKALDPCNVHESQQHTRDTGTLDDSQELTVDLQTSEYSEETTLDLKEALFLQQNIKDLRATHKSQQNSSLHKVLTECQQHITEEKTLYGTEKNITTVSKTSDCQQYCTDLGDYDKSPQVSVLDRIPESEQQTVPFLSHDDTQELTLVNSGDLDDTDNEVSQLGTPLGPHDQNEKLIVMQETIDSKDFQGDSILTTDKSHLRILSGKHERGENKLGPNNKSASFDETSSSSFNVPNFSHVHTRDNLYPEENAYILPCLERGNYDKIYFKENVSIRTNQDDFEKCLGTQYSNDQFHEYNKKSKGPLSDPNLDKNPVDLSNASSVYSSKKTRNIENLDESHMSSVYSLEAKNGKCVLNEASDMSESTSNKKENSEYRSVCKRKYSTRNPGDNHRQKKVKKNKSVNVTLERSIDSVLEGSCEQVMDIDVSEDELESEKTNCDKYDLSTHSTLKESTTHIVITNNCQLALSTQNYSKNLPNNVDSTHRKDGDDYGDACGNEEIALFINRQKGALLAETDHKKRDGEVLLSSNLRPVCCRSCKKELPDVSLLSLHLRQCEGHLTCTFCQEKFVRKVTFSRHMEGHKRNVCSKCPQSFCSHKKLKAHMKSEHNYDLVSKTYPCHRCSRSFLKRSSLYYHLRVHATENEHVCQKCGEFCKGSESYKLHMAEHLKATNFHCHICSASFRRRQQYDDHLKHHKKNNCEICGQPHTTKRALVRHCRIEHKSLPQNITVNREYKCEKCERVFNRPSILRHHLQLHGGVKPLECRLCNKQFSHKRGLRKHMNSIIHEHMLLTNNLQKDHAYDVKQNFAFVCEYCGIKLPSRHMLSKHSRMTHKVGITWSCPHCDYKTKRNHTLKRHMELHLESRNFMCEICGNSFQALATLKDHHNFVHSDERNYKCSECNKSFKNKSSLARHCRTHSDDRPYQCHCGTSYKRLSHLKRHMSSAHNEILKSRAVKKFKQSEETETNTDRSYDGQDPTQSTEISDGEEFEFVSVSNSSLSPVIQTEASVKSTSDILLPAQESIILMGESSNSDQGHLITVGDSQIIQLIPSTFQFPQESSFQAVSLVSTSELHTLPLSTTAPYGQVAHSNQVVVEPFSLSQNSDTMVMVPASQEDHAHLGDSDAIRTTFRTLENESLSESSHIGREKRGVKEEMSLHTLENHTELSVTPSLDTFDYNTTPTSQTLLPTLPPAHYITHTHNSNTQISQELLQPNLICSDFVLPVDEGR